MKNTLKKSRKNGKTSKKRFRKSYRKQSRKYKRQIGRGIVPRTNAKLYFNEKMGRYRGNNTGNMNAPIDPFITGCDYEGFNRILDTNNIDKIVPSATAQAAQAALASDPTIQKYVGKICEYPPDNNRHTDNSNIKPIIFNPFPSAGRQGYTGLPDGKYKYIIQGRKMLYSQSHTPHIDCIKLYAYNNNWPGYDEFPDNHDSEISHSCLSSINTESNSSFELERDDENVYVNAGNPMKTVEAAGEFRIVNGKIQKLNTYSGHFKPCSESIFIVFDFLTTKLRYKNLAIWPDDLEPQKEQENDECATYKRYFIFDKFFDMSNESNNYV